MKTTKQSSPDLGRYRWAEPDAQDRALFDRSLKQFVPPNAFDAHAHLYRVKDLGAAGAPLPASGPAEVSLSTYRERVGRWMPKAVPSGGLFIPYPTKTVDVAAANQYLIGQLQSDPGSRALMLIAPQQDPAAVERDLRANRFAGFKVYHLLSGLADSFAAPTETFFPEWAWELADRYGLAVTLHLVMPRALAEPANQQYIRKHCEQYRNARLILAHAARGFCGRHTVEGIGALRGLENVFFDTSAICEAAAFEAILETFGPTRLMFGTDFPVSELRTRCVDLGDGFVWLNEIGADFGNSKFARPTLLGIESLLALQQACRNQHLTDTDVEQIFCRSARVLFGLPVASPLPDVQQAYRDAKKIIPGGTQLLSKRPEMFAPDQWPAYFREAHGCEVVDLEGRRYIDMSTSGILSCLLGYANPEVNAAVLRRISLGSMATQQTYDEVEVARILTEIHPWAHMARFARTGGESMAIAVRIVRARTGRDKVAICGYHGWHDWYLAANLPSTGAAGPDDRLVGHLLPGLEPKGVPAALAGTAMTFRYNRLDELDAIIAQHGPELAAVVMEPTRYQDPQPGFLEGVRERCDKLGAKLVFDEITIGWRLCLGGSHLRFGVTPDVAVFAKALGNGFAFAAVIGTGDTMEAAQGAFISSTYWTEGVGPAAALATLRQLRQIDAPAHLRQLGQQAIDGWTRLGKKHGVPVQPGGRVESPLIGVDHPESMALTTLMTVKMLSRGFLASGNFVATMAHEPRHVDAYLAALDEVFGELAAAIRDGDIRRRIGGPVKHAGFARLT